MTLDPGLSMPQSWSLAVLLGLEVYAVVLDLGESPLASEYAQDMEIHGPNVAIHVFDHHSVHDQLMQHPLVGVLLRYQARR
ncbi:hypothetical protein GN958_ATG01912 [Phytophthora infestans]|nr:hypothetical protein GN958_ATG01912 [Phytophthora infestans]